MKLLFICTLLFVIIGYTYGQNKTLPVCTANLGGVAYSLQPGLCTWTVLTGLSSPRTIRVASNGDILVLEQGANRVTVLYDLNGNGVIDQGESSILAIASGLNHGLIIKGSYLYATSSSTVYRWLYTPGNRTDLGTPQIVLNSVPSGGNHQTRTIEFTPTGDAFYLSVGSAANVDPTSIRSRVVKCAQDLTAIPSGGYSYTTCTVYADGCRNEVGLRVDSTGVLWGVENGFDGASRSDLGGDIHNDNPCEEVNRFDKVGFYGYPYCFSEGVLPAPYGRGSGNQWAYNTSDTNHLDSWCNQTTNVIPPAFCMQAHTAPLDLMFTDTSTFPGVYKSGLLVAQHGSWDRTPPSGYQVLHIQLNSNGLPIAQSSTKLIGPASNNTNWGGIRPVALAVLRPCGAASECLLFSSDNSGGIYAIRSSDSSPSTTGSTTGGSSSIVTGLSFTLILLLSISILLF